MSTETAPIRRDDDAPLKVMFREEDPRGDRSYILGCWDQGWGDSIECRSLSSRRYHHQFQDLVAGGNGVLARPSTKVLVGCSPEDRDWIWCFCVFTPGSAMEDGVPVIHWMSTRPTIRFARGGSRSIRRKGLATRMLATGGEWGPGVRDRLVYTCRPGRQMHAATAREAVEIEADLLEAGKKLGVVATYFPLERWMAR